MLPLPLRFKLVSLREPSCCNCYGFLVDFPLCPSSRASDRDYRHSAIDTTPPEWSPATLTPRESEPLPLRMNSQSLLLLCILACCHSRSVVRQQDDRDGQYVRGRFLPQHIRSCSFHIAVPIGILHPAL